MPFKVAEIVAVAKKYDIPLIEDSAESLGSTYKGQHCGTFGDIAILSFNGNKIITTSGGGALVTKNRAIKDKTIFLATQARDKAPHYEHSHIGYNYRLSNICAGIGRGQMEVLDEHIELRRGMHQFYKELFHDWQEITVFTEFTSEVVSNHWLTCITVAENSSEITSEKIRLHLEKQNIESRPLWKPMHLQPVFKSAPYYGANNSEDLFKKGLCLPSGSNLTVEEKQRINIAFRQLI
jgi:dTDP-4-amino-4,6-dideoxygalactose transaminase